MTPLIDSLTACPDLRFTYVHRRDEFLKHAESSDAEISRYLVDRGLEGEELTIDSAYVGPDEPYLTAIIDSGVHGAELGIGSEIQRALISQSRFMKFLFENQVGALFIHAASPIAAYWGSRTTRRITWDGENGNVDLNRNWRDHNVPLPATELYKKFYRVIHPDQITIGSELRMAKAYLIGLVQHGKKEMKRHFGTGQSEFPKGVQYVGAGKTREAKKLSEVFRYYLSRKPRVCLIPSFHTGLPGKKNRYGDFMGLVEAERGSEKFRRLEEWLPCETQATRDDSCVSVPLTGNIEEGVREAAEEVSPKTEVLGVTLEAAVCGEFRAAMFLHLDNYIHTNTDPRINPPLAQFIKRGMRKVFDPTNLKQRESFVRKGVQIIHAALAGAAYHAKQSI